MDGSRWGGAGVREGAGEGAGAWSESAYCELLVARLARKLFLRFANRE